MASFVLTEEQYKQLKEADASKLQVNANVYPGTNSAQKLQNAQTAAQKAGVTDPSKVNYNVSGNTASTVTGTTTESRIITKRQIEEMRAKKLRENSRLYSLKDFIGK